MKKICLLTISLFFLFVAPSAFAIPINFRGVNYQAVLVAPNYPGGLTFDDNLAISRSVFARGLSTWANWRRGPGGNIDELPGNATAAQFLNAFVPYQAGGAHALGNGDVFLAFYFGHGSTGPRSPGNDAEQVPALNIWDESMVFGDKSFITDDVMMAAFAAFNPGVYKIFIDVSCFSGGMWNGNDNPVISVGDLEKVPRSILLSSSRENQFTFTGGIFPRPWEPLFLVNMINTLFFANHGRDLSLGEFFVRSFAAGSAINASRLAEDNLPPGDELWELLVSGDFESALFSNVPLDELPAFGIPEPNPILLMALGLAFMVIARQNRKLGGKPISS